VRVYCARIEADAGPSKLGKEKKPAQKRLPKAALAIIAVVVIAGAGNRFHSEAPGTSSGDCGG